MSLMPENIRQILEKGTSPIINRIKFLQKLYEAGYNTHINFSPIIFYKGWLDDYKILFELINNEVSEDFKKQCGLECIFLTHNSNLHNINISKNLVNQESLLWNPKIQEEKVSQFGVINLRYDYKFKYKLIQEFTDLVNSVLKIKIRYIF